VSEDKAVAWLREQVQARKAAAEAAAGPDWFLDSSDDADERSVRYTGPSTLRPGELADYCIADRVDVLDAAHIALNDPQDVIARCEAELEILLEFSTRHDDATERQREWIGLRLAVRLLASGYKHREGYEAHWGSHCAA
jgi:hypothetical protein